MNAVLKYPGSKWNLASWIINYFPEHHSYLEPFFGSTGKKSTGLTDHAAADKRIA